jgi:hypothetical protein
MEKKRQNDKETSPSSVASQFRFDDTSMSERRIRRMEEYLKTFSGYDPSDPNQGVAGVKQSLLFSLQFRATSVILEPSIESKDNVGEKLLEAQTAAKTFQAHFKESLERVIYHTELFTALSVLRETVGLSSNRNLNRAVIDIHDCIRAAPPEEMNEMMAITISNVLGKLSSDITFEDLPFIAEELFASGLRVWPQPSNPDKVAEV